MAEKLLQTLGRELRYFEYKLRQRKARKQKERDRRHSSSSSHHHHRHHRSRHRHSRESRHSTSGASTQKPPDENNNVKFDEHLHTWSTSRNSTSVGKDDNITKFSTSSAEPETSQTLDYAFLDQRDKNKTLSNTTASLISTPVKVLNSDFPASSNLLHDRTLATTPHRIVNQQQPSPDPWGIFASSSTNAPAILPVQSTPPSDNFDPFASNEVAPNNNSLDWAFSQLAVVPESPVSPTNVDLLSDSPSDQMFAELFPITSETQSRSEAEIKAIDFLGPKADLVDLDNLMTRSIKPIDRSLDSKNLNTIGSKPNPFLVQKPSTSLNEMKKSSSPIRFQQPGALNPQTLMLTPTPNLPYDPLRLETNSPRFQLSPTNSPWTFINSTKDQNPFK